MESQSPEAPQKTAHRGHHRHASAQRPIAARRSTKGPLDLDDEYVSPVPTPAPLLTPSHSHLSITITDSLRSPNTLVSPISPPPHSASPSRSPSRSPAYFPDPAPSASTATATPSTILPAPIDSSRHGLAHTAVADSVLLSSLTHLLRPSLFHSLPPPAVPFQLPPASTPLTTLLSTGHFRAAALLSARFLSTPPGSTDPVPPPTPFLASSHVQSPGPGAHGVPSDLPSGPPRSAAHLFALWHIRLVTLCLLGLEHVAADESRALADVVDAPVYRRPRSGDSVMPWALRVLALRLQARAEGDLGRAVVGMYALAREARRKVRQEEEDEEEEDGAGVREGRQVWAERLRDLEIRVAGLLVEMGDLGGASRVLKFVRARSESDGDVNAGRLVLLHLHTGNVARAREVAERAKKEREHGYAATLMPLVEAADGNYEGVVEANDQVSTASADPMLLQNLAVCLMYSGRLDRAKEILLELTGKRGFSFPTLLFNLSTMFELTTDKAKEQKLALGRRLVGKSDASLGVESSVADLKL